MLEYNMAIFESLRKFSDFPFVGVMADFPIFFLPLFLAGVWLYHVFKKQDTSGKAKQELLHIFYACVLGIVFSYIIKQFVDIERPDAYMEQTKQLLLSHIPEKSFPSDHATVSFAFLTGLLYTCFRKIFYIYAPFVILMNISRIIVGVHWPLDIFAGSLLGIFSAIIFFRYISQLKFVKALDLFIIKCMKYIKLY